MKWILLLAVALLLRANEVRSEMACFNGTKMMLSLPVPLPAEVSDVTCMNTDVCLVTRMRVAMNGLPGLPAGLSGRMEVGSCVPDTTCSSINCDIVMSEARKNMPSFPQGMSMELSDCEIVCGQPASAGVAQMPVLPMNPENQPEEIGCNLPMWNLKLGDNFIHFSGIRRDPLPKFTLIVKKTRRGYIPGRAYKIVVKASSKKLRMTGFYITLHNTNSSSCSLGSFIGDRRRIAGAPQVQPGCTQPLISDYPRGAKRMKIVGGKWVAPEGCADLGEVEIRVEVRGTDGRLYRDFDQSPPENRALTKVIRLRKKKSKGRKKNKRRRQ